jgi:gamma-glutamyl hercynylcysteine S-oxide synthase
MAEALFRRAAELDDPVAIRHAGPELLALALMDSRNALLALLPQLPWSRDSALARRVIGAGAWQEWWISRHVQRGRGEACEADAPRLAGIEPRLDTWLRAEQRPSPEELHAYLEATLELTLDLLAGADDSDTALHVYRQALRHEDRLVESLREAAGVGSPAPRPERPALVVPATRWRLGSAGPGFVPEAERGDETEALPAFEIDAQVVNWARFAEFASDGGYDDDRWWTPAGRAWRDAEGRRAPARVEQLAGGVVVQRGLAGQARLERAPAQQAAAHVTRFEAEAWCRWAGRRLPAEPEWDLAARSLASQGFAWGDVHEWMLGRARPLAGAGPVAQLPDALERAEPGLALRRGASWATPPRWRHPQSRRYAHPRDDSACCGFRSCAL